jgi:hypothetical protein
MVIELMPVKSQNYINITYLKKNTKLTEIMPLKSQNRTYTLYLKKA